MTHNSIPAAPTWAVDPARLGPQAFRSALRETALRSPEIVSPAPAARWNRVPVPPAAPKAVVKVAPVWIDLPSRP